MSKPRPNARTRRRMRRRIHRGRVGGTLMVLAALIIGIMCLVSRCGNEPVEVFASPDHIAQQHSVAAEAGRRDAERALRYAPGTMERQHQLLYIHSRHMCLLDSGYPQAASQYITAARQRLQAH